MLQHCRVVICYAREKVYTFTCVVCKCSQDMLFYGPLEKCPICGSDLEYAGSSYSCNGAYSEWSSCVFSTRDPPRKSEPIVYPDFVEETPISDVMLVLRGLSFRLVFDIFGMFYSFIYVM